MELLAMRILKSLMQNVPRYSTLGGYSSKAVHPIALGKVLSIEKMKAKFNDADYYLSGIGGVEIGGDATEFILLGANTVQLRTRFAGLFFVCPCPSTFQFSCGVVNLLKCVHKVRS